MIKSQEQACLLKVCASVSIRVGNVESSITASSEGTVSLGVCFSSPKHQAVDHSLIIVASHTYHMSCASIITWHSKQVTHAICSHRGICVVALSCSLIASIWYASGDSEGTVSLGVCFSSTNRSGSRSLPHHGHTCAIRTFSLSARTIDSTRNN